MKHLLTFSLFLFTLSLQASFTRLATETYPGGGGVATNAVAGITTNGVPVALDAAKIAHLIIPEGGGPTGGVTKAYVDNATNALSLALVPRIVDAAEKGTNYTDSATNALSLALVPRIVDVAEKGTNYTDSATNELSLALVPRIVDAAEKGTNYTDSATNELAVAMNDRLMDEAALREAGDIAATNYTDAATNAVTSFVKAGYLPLAGGEMYGGIILTNETDVGFYTYIRPNDITLQDDDKGSVIYMYSTTDDDGDSVLMFEPNTMSSLTSPFTPDGTPVVTSNMLNGVLAPATNETITAAKIYADRMGAADWNETTAYVKGNFVWYTDETTPENTGLYVASKPGTNLPPPLNPDYWTKMPDANALFSQSNAQLSKNFLPWKGGSNAYVEWQGQNVRVYNGGLFARTLDLQAGFNYLTAYEGGASYTKLPDYLRGATWNTAADPFAKKSDIVSAETITNIVESAAVTNEGAKAYADGKFLPLEGGEITGNVTVKGHIFADDSLAIKGGIQLSKTDGTDTSYIYPDGTPVLTAKKAETDYPAITNSYPFALGNMVSNTVSQWEGYWTGSNVYWEVTNYLDSADAKIMRLMEIQTNGVVREVWNDTDKYTIFFTNTLEKVENTNAYTRGWVGEFVTNSLADKADRAWGNHTSAGADAPTNMVWHTAPTTVFAGGFEFSKVAIAGGEIGVLVSKGCVPYAAGAEGKFIIGDGFGTNYFGFVKKDDYIIATRVDGIEVDQATKMVTLTYDLVFSGEYPIVYYSPSVIPITAQTWIQLNKSDGTLTPGAPWPVTFSTGAGYIKAHISFASATAEMPPEGFFTSSTAVIGGGTFKTNMKADFLDAGIMCTNTDTKVMGVIRPTFDGTTVHWNWSKQ